MNFNSLTPIISFMQYWCKFGWESKREDLKQDKMIYEYLDGNHGVSEAALYLSHYFHKTNSRDTGNLCDVILCYIIR